MPRFISAEVEPFFAEEPIIKKRAGAPDAFTWEGERFEVVELLNEWHLSDKGRERGGARRPQGHGRDYYRVRTSVGRIFELYYDRRSKNHTISGIWILWRELTEDEAT